MRLTLTIAFLICCFLARPSTAPAQSVLSAGQVGVVTTDGFFLPDTGGSTPLVMIPASAFLGAANLANPAVEWERGTDAFLVATGPGLFRVTISGLVPAAWSVVDITPSSGQPLDLRDLDVHLGSGDLYLADKTFDLVLRYEAPFVAGMIAAQEIPVHARNNAIAIDSRSHPGALLSLATGEVRRQPLSGSSTVVVTYLNGPTGLDHDPRLGGKQGTCMVSRNGNVVARATNNPNLVVSMNFLGFCTPLVLAPVDIEWDPLSNRAFVLAEDGLNNGGACFGSGLPAVGPNHIVKFPVAQGGPVVPTLYTAPAGSGITGADGDLAIVHGDFGFVSPYGVACDPAMGQPPRLDLHEPAVTIAAISLTLLVDGGAPNVPVWMVLGTQAAEIAMPSGCLLLASTDEVRLVGTTDALGAYSGTFPLPALSLGLEAYVQVGLSGPAGVALTEGLEFHIGL